jgi:hypothetical protein
MYALIEDGVWVDIMTLGIYECMCQMTHVMIWFGMLSFSKTDKDSKFTHRNCQEWNVSKMVKDWYGTKSKSRHITFIY